MWEWIWLYARVFLTGGLICAIGQVVVNRTKVTAARILVGYLLLGVLLEGIGVFKYVEEFCRAGVTIPIIGFGSTLAKGAIKGAEIGLLEAVTGSVVTASAGLASAIIFGFIFSIIFKSHSKKT